MIEINANEFKKSFDKTIFVLSTVALMAMSIIFTLLFITSLLPEPISEFMISLIFTALLVFSAIAVIRVYPDQWYSIVLGQVVSQLMFFYFGLSVVTAFIESVIATTNNRITGELPSVNINIYFNIFFLLLLFMLIGVSVHWFISKNLNVKFSIYEWTMGLMIINYGMIFNEPTAIIATIAYINLDQLARLTGWRARIIHWFLDDEDKPKR